MCASLVAYCGHSRAVHGSSAPACGQDVRASVWATYSAMVGCVRLRRYHHSVSLTRHDACAHHWLRTAVTRERFERASVRSGRVREGVGNVQCSGRVRSLTQVPSLCEPEEERCLRPLSVTYWGHLRAVRASVRSECVCVWAWATYSTMVGCVVDAGTLTL